MQRTEIIGHLGGDAQVNAAQSGNQAIGFTVAVSEKYTANDGQQRETTTWYRCTLWKRPDQSTAVAQYLRKGTQVFVEGKVTARAYTNQAGEMQASLDLNVSPNGLKLLGSSGGSSAGSPAGPGAPAHGSHAGAPAAQPYQARPAAQAMPDADLPF